MFGPRKGHVLVIFNRLFADMWAVLLTSVVIIFSDSSSIGNIMGGLIGPIVVILIALLFRIATYNFSTYEVNKDMFIIRTGVFKKSKDEIPLETITTVDFSQSIIFQVAKVNLVKVESTAKTLVAQNLFAL